MKPIIDELDELKKQYTKNNLPNNHSVRQLSEEISDLYYKAV